MGHVVNIGDLGFDMGPDSLYFQQNIHHNIMWHSGDSTIVSIESPQLGDKAGAIFCCTDFSETPQVDAIYNIYEMSDITNNLTVSSWKRLEIDGVGLSNTAKFASGVKIDVYGTLDLNSANLTRSGASDWSGIDIRSGGTVNVLSELVSTLESPEYKPESLPADLMLSLQVAGNMAEDLGLDPDIKKSFDRIGSLVLPRVRILKAGAEGILNAGGE